MDKKSDKMVLKAGLYTLLPPSALVPRFDETLQWELLIVLWQNDVTYLQYGDDIILG